MRAAALPASCTTSGDTTGARAAEIRLAARQAQEEFAERRQARARVRALRRRARQLGRPVPPAAERIKAGMALAAMRRVIDAPTAARLAELLLRSGGPRAAFHCAASPPRSLREVADRCAEVAREPAIPRPRWLEAVETLGLEPAVALRRLIDRRAAADRTAVGRPILRPAAFLTNHLRRKREEERVRTRPFGARQSLTAVARPAVSPVPLLMESRHARQ